MSGWLIPLLAGAATGILSGFGIGGGSLIARLLGTVRWLGFNIPMLFILNALFGMYGLVWSQVTADILTVTMSFIVYFKFRPALLKGKRGSAEAPAA